MTRPSERNVALSHLKSSWEAMNKYIDEGTANTCDLGYSFHKDLFERALNYIESFDRRYKKDEHTDED